jgi:hypothetical protein
MNADGNDVNIAVMGPNHSLRFYWAQNGTATWHAETIANGRTTYSAPAMNVDSPYVNITAVGRNDSLRFYRAIIGLTTWYAQQIAPAGSAR